MDQGHCLSAAATSSVLREETLRAQGGIENQASFPFGSRRRGGRGTNRMIDTLGKGGGHVLAGGHAIQRDVPPENVVAMFDAARTHRYKGAGP